MLAYAGGDRAAFARLYAKHKDSLYRYLLRACQHPGNAEDLAQEVWTKVIRAKARYRADAKFSTFLYRIAHNTFIDFTRRNRLSMLQMPFDESLHPGTGEPSPEDAAEHAGARQLFAAALAALPCEQRDAWLLHEEVGLTVATIADITGVTPETAKSRIRYAVVKLKRSLDVPRPAAREKVK